MGGVNDEMLSVELSELIGREDTANPFALNGSSRVQDLTVAIKDLGPTDTAHSD